MTVKEYANDVNRSVAEILKKCSELAIDVNSANDELSNDDIVILDNTLELISTESDVTNEEQDELVSKVESIMEQSNIMNVEKDDIVKPKKNKNKKNVEDFKNKRKEMYKNKEKLQSNESSNDDVILYKESTTVQSLSSDLNVSATEIIKKLMNLGVMATINQSLDFDTTELIVTDYNKTLKKEESADISNFEEFEIIDDEASLVKRPPVVTIMGHVDHGKTTLLDYIRSSHVVNGEFGGITQHIGAYQTTWNNEKITFIDTPGHAAFTEMRARGASVTDIVIIIVAADDGVMPQTEEAIDHALSANVPIVVAVNKIDKSDANPDRIMSEMAEKGITPEEWGGKYPFVKISAKTGEGVDLLLETIIAIAEIENLRANPSRYAIGSVIESKVDKKVGGVASILIQNGTLRLGDPIVVGTSFGHVRTMRNDLGENIVEAGPSLPVEITGLSDNPAAGDRFMAFESESQAKKVAEKRANAEKENKFKKEVLNFEDLFNKIQSGTKEINVVLKCDVRGSEEAVKNALTKIDVEGVKVKVIRSGIGTITESDIVLANASDAIIIGFNVSPSSSTKDIAKEYNVEIRLYTIIYKLIEEIELAMKGMLDPEFEENIVGSAEVRQLFKFSKVGTIAGSHVIEGVVKQNCKARVIRDGKIIYDGEISSLQREKDSVKEVKKGLDCGITLENYNDIKQKDIIEAYEIVEVKRV